MKPSQPNRPTADAAGGETLPLLPMQAAKWRAHVTLGQTGVNLEQVVVSFREPVDMERLREAWDRMVAHTPTLRTRFILDRAENEPKQVVEPSATAPWQVLDWSAKGADALSQAWESFLCEDRRRGFDVSTAPLLRFTWIRLGPAEGRLIWTFHHLLLDGRSMSMVVEDVFGAYQALLEGRAVILPDRPGSDLFARWQQAWWDSHRDQAEMFWRTYLKGLAAPTLLTVDLSAGARTAASEGATVGFALSQDDTKELERTAASLGVTTNTFVQAAWGMLLRSYSGQDDVVFGTVRAGRGGTIPEASSALGLFITSVPMRFDFGGSATVATVLRELRARNLALRGFEHTPMDQVARWSELPAGSRLFESAIVFDRDSVAGRMAERCGGSGRTFELLQHADQPLLLSITGSPELAGHLVFDRARFPRPLMQRMAGQFVHLLRELPRCPDRRLADVSVLPPEELAELSGFGRGPLAVPHPDRLLQGWFEERARSDPSAVAVQTPEQATTYGQLEAAANRLAHHLQRLGAGPDRLVAVVLPRSTLLVTALLGVLKSGAAYLPIDHSMPPERLALMIRTARPLAVIAGCGVKIPHDDIGGTWIDLDTDQAMLAACPDMRPESAARPTDLAYAIFTSGTTGTPKLVGIEHRNILNLLAFALAELFVPEDLACVPFTSSVAGDGCVQQVFAALALGGTLVPFPDLLTLGSSPFFRRFTWLGASPALLQRFSETFGLPPAVRLVGVGAEVTPPALLERLRAHPSIREIYNFYGPTEATVYCTVARLAQAAAGPAGLSDGGPRNLGRLIGRPVANTRCHVLDAHGRPVPLGVTGELVVAGAGVGRGYLNDPGLTRERFVDEPGQTGGHSRAYRTGDLVRWHPDGLLEFLGRRDTQIKVSGVRVELEDIESHLLAFPGIAQAAVTNEARPDGGRRLVAFVCAPSAGFDPVAIRRFLRGRLPNTLVPGALVRIDAMPLTLAGKVDRQKLPQPETAPSAGRSGRPTPDNDTERQLLDIWSQVLRFPSVGADDDFFESGGDSLQAAVLLMSIEADFGTKLTAADFIASPTPRELAARIDGDRASLALSAKLLGDGNEGRFVRIQQGGHKPPFLVFLGGYGVDESPGVYESLFKEVPDHPVHCFVPPKLDHRETPAHNLRFLVRDALRALGLSGLAPDGEAIILTRCVGSVLGLEFARHWNQGGQIPIAMLDPAMPIGPLAAILRTIAFSPLGIQVSYHRDKLRTGDWPTRSAYARGVIDRAFRRTVGRFGSGPAPESSRSRRADLHRHYQDLATYPRAMLAHRSKPHAGPMLVLVNQAEAKPRRELTLRGLARGHYRFEQVPGDHISVTTHHAADVAAALRRWIGELEKTGPRPRP